MDYSDYTRVTKYKTGNDNAVTLMNRHIYSPLRYWKNFGKKRGENHFLNLESDKEDIFFCQLKEFSNCYCRRDFIFIKQLEIGNGA